MTCEGRLHARVTAAGAPRARPPGLGFIIARSRPLAPPQQGVRAARRVCVRACVSSSADAAWPCGPPAAAGWRGTTLGSRSRRRGFCHASQRLCTYRPVDCVCPCGRAVRRTPVFPRGAFRLFLSKGAVCARTAAAGPCASRQGRARFLDVCVEQQQNWTGLVQCQPPPVVQRA